MGTRLELQALLESLDVDAHVYFQPPSNIQMVFPAIVYSRDQEDATFADNSPYYHKTRYQVMIIDANPDSTIPALVRALPMTRYVRHFTTMSLYHDIYTMYF